MRPTWQVDDCPSWCAIEHHESDHPDDRSHRTATEAVAVIVRSSAPGHDGMVRRVEAAELEIGLSRVDGQSETWLYIGSGPGSALEFSLESAARVHRELGARLAGWR